MSETKKAVQTANSLVPSNQSGSRNLPKSPASRHRLAGGVDIFSLIVIVVVVLAIGVSGFFIYRNGALKSDLKKAQDAAKKQSVELQAKVDAANDRVRTAADQLTQAQTQAEQAKAEAVGAKAAVDKAAGEAAELKKQLDLARRQAAEVKAGADKAAAELAKLKAQLEALSKAQAPAATSSSAKPAPAEQSAPAKTAGVSSKSLPVKATFKKAPMLEGNALAIENTSTASLTLTVTFSNATGSKELPVTLEPGAVKEMGWLGAWVLASGDKVEIKSAGYETIVKTAP